MKSYPTDTIVESYKDEENRIHRSDGPALIWNSGRLSWYYYGSRMSFYDWCMQLNKTEEEIVILKLKYHIPFEHIA